MRRTLLLARLGGWLYLLGSILALVAFFPPYWSSPPESLGQIFMSDFLYYSLPLLHFPLSNALFGSIAVWAVLLLVLLPVNVLLACVALLTGGSFQIVSLSIYLKFPGVTMLCYIGGSLFTLMLALLDGQDANQVINENAFTQTLTQLSIGA